MTPEKAAELQRKKEQVEKIIDEMGEHLGRLEQLGRDAERIIGNGPDFLKEYGQEGIQVALELFDKLQRFGAKFQRLKAGGDPHGPV